MTSEELDALTLEWQAIAIGCADLKRGMTMVENGLAAMKERLVPLDEARLAAQPAAAPQWVPVGERLPESELIPVLAASSYYAEPVQAWWSKRFGWNTRTGCGTEKLTDVYAWCEMPPLPEPPV